MLKPCPFCGNKDPEILTEAEINDHDPDPTNDEYHACSEPYGVICVYSPGCGAVGGIRVKKEDAIIAWNRRI